MATEKNWIENATANAHGQFAKKAKAAGMSTITFAKKSKNSKNKVTARQANLAATLMRFNKKKKSKTDTESPVEDKMMNEEQD